METNKREIWEIDAAQLGEILNVTDRRIRQLHEQNEIPRNKRGLYDVTWAVHWQAGKRALNQHRARQFTPLQLVAIGWLAAMIAIDPDKLYQDDIDAFTEAAARWGVTPGGVTGLLMIAAAALGKTSRYVTGGRENA
ncbi:hypothetical protein THIAE_05765 [Thiomicrospira aerophila AL3]|uniref:Uncharacterized protein n=1 Tax=Thiomicrospira aerophila AL3 TaxID=717772 RepID=W0DUK4_9GAMM|nr:hypothetical protein [Thiomicrospira aerophila]AHF02255.1 hypothetical protein THIAE_05765 [Thiomicrospira aerophila AL3]